MNNATDTYKRIDLDDFEILLGITADDYCETYVYDKNGNLWETWSNGEPEVEFRARRKSDGAEYKVMSIN